MEEILLGNEEDIRDRIADEIDDLVDKKDHLSNFLDSEDFEKLPKKEQHLMIQQLFVMKQYIKILDDRYVAIRERQYECKCQ